PKWNSCAVIPSRGSDLLVGNHAAPCAKKQPHQQLRGLSNLYLSFTHAALPIALLSAITAPQFRIGGFK
ncbi:MAG TPA: hypothetical protein VFU50_14515, partial [Terriglobales bacterium]|nr:hypothetical protein [Terriglobales bacterium]